MKNFDTGYWTQLNVLDEAGEAVIVNGEPVTEAVFISRADRGDRDRTFRINGLTFTCRAAVSPEAVAEWTMMLQGEIQADEREALAIYDRTVLAFLEPGQEELWREARNPDALSPINMVDLRALLRWLFEAQTGRPTERSSSSSAGPGRTAETLTDGSSSRVEPVGAAI